MKSRNGSYHGKKEYLYTGVCIFLVAITQKQRPFNRRCFLDSFSMKLLKTLLHNGTGLLVFRLNQTVSIAFSLIYHIYLVCFCIAKYEEIMS